MTQTLFLEDSYNQECTVLIKRVDGEKVILDQTIFYPTGGGQECDTGVLMQNGHAYEVYQVKKEAGQIVHYVKGAETLNEGEAVVKIDWQRRYGLMRHHSLLHVLGAVVYEKYGALCTGNQIYPERARIDFNQLQDLSSEEVEEIVREANTHHCRRSSDHVPDCQQGGGRGDFRHDQNDDQPAASSRP